MTAVATILVGLLAPIVRSPLSTRRSPNGTALARATVYTLTQLGLPASGACTILWKGSLSSVSTGTEQVLFSVDDNSNVNRLYVRSPGSGATLTLVRTLASVSVTANFGNVTADTVYRVGLSIPGDGTAIGSLDGAATISVSGGPTSGLSRLRLSASATGSPANDTIQTCVVRAGAMSAADLRTAVSAL